MTTTVMCIMDGLGLNPSRMGNAVELANTPNLDRLFSTAPHTTLCTHGERVGLPAGQMGNSEVGHLNIGAGRVVEQSLLRIARSFQEDRLSSSVEWLNFIEAAKTAPTLHVAGLYSDGGVHSHSEHLHLLLPRLRRDYQGQIALHLFTDGRDTAEKAFGQQLPTLLELIKDIPNCDIATITGRFFAMDRDTRWDRISQAYEAMVGGIGTYTNNSISAIAAAYSQNLTDEFITPIVVNPISIEASDAVLWFNFRADRMREIVGAVCTQSIDIPIIRIKPRPSPERTLCFTNYDSRLELPVLFHDLKIINYLGEVISRQDIGQLRVAETEKYPHVTYFFNGREEIPSVGEERVLIPSVRDVETYDLKPEMSAAEITEAVISGIESDKFGLIVVNFANCDMVGHSGKLEPTVKAVECVDSCVGKIVQSLEAHAGQGLFFADHGNAEQMIQEDGSPQTAHTTFPVPCILTGAGPGLSLRAGGSLCDLAPTILDLMDIPKPSEMTGESLLVRQNSSNEPT